VGILAFTQNRQGAFRDGREYGFLGSDPITTSPEITIQYTIWLNVTQLVMLVRKIERSRLRLTMCPVLRQTIVAVLWITKFTATNCGIGQ
jgi:hypothetical protein